MSHNSTAHLAGTLPDCAGCQSACYCDGKPGDLCVFCLASIDQAWGDWQEATYDPDTHPWDRIEEINGHA